MNMNLLGGDKALAMATDDNELMEAVRDGKVEKLAVLFERYQIMLYNFFLRLTSNRSASEDLVQDVFMRILKYRSGYHGRSRFTFWLFQIARNAHIDYLRKQKNELSLDEQIEQPPASSPSPEKTVETDEDIALLRRALESLSWRKREILVLSRIEELKIHEVAEITGCKIGTVKAQIHRSLKELGRMVLKLKEGETT